MAKMNYLHLHLTDTASWPIEIEAYPELAKSASYKRKTYPRTVVRDLVEFAKTRGVRLLPEIDSPGHSAAKLDAEEVTAKHGPIVQCTALDYNTGEYCGEPPAG